MKKITHLKLKLLLAVTALTLLAFYIYFDIPCVFLTLLGVPCPGCGMTRAWRYAFQLDFFNAFKYNSMFWSVPVIGILVLFDGKLFKNEKFNRAVVIILAIGFVTAYLAKLFIPSQRNLFI